jgi:hypothetical protein
MLETAFSFYGFFLNNEPSNTAITSAPAPTNKNMFLLVKANVINIAEAKK